jgi:P27 family predicted phage terminase small subunit
MKAVVKPLFLKREVAKPPKGLSSEARKFWKSIVDEYDINDPAGLRLLQRACEALGRLRNAQTFLKKDGEVISDKKGSVKAHPAVKIEEGAHKQMLDALKMLNLDLEPLRDKPGRPGGR